MSRQDLRKDTVLAQLRLVLPSRRVHSSNYIYILEWHSTGKWVNATCLGSLTFFYASIEVLKPHIVGNYVELQAHYSAGSLLHWAIKPGPKWHVQRTSNLFIRIGQRILLTVTLEKLPLMNGRRHLACEANFKPDYDYLRYVRET